MQVHVEKKTHQENHVSLTDHEDFGNLFPERFSENELIPRSGSSYILHSQVGASAYPVTGRLSDSPLISQEVKRLIVNLNFYPRGNYFMFNVVLVLENTFIRFVLRRRLKGIVRM